jgi:GTPase SAR1 family protein
LVYLGYCGSFHEAVIIHKNRKNSLLHGHKRNVFNCYILGDEKVGKTHFLETIIKEQVEEEMLELEETRSVVTTFRMNNKHKYLVLSEFNAATIEDVLLNNRRMMNYCDVF